MKIREFEIQNIKFIEVTNEINFKVELTDLGAAIYGIYLNEVPMTLTTVNVEDFIRNDYYHGKTIGRVSGRLKDGKYTVNGVTYQTEINEGKNALHGGVNGLSSKYFNYDIKEVKDGIEVKFTYLSKAGESGYNSNMNLTITYLIPKYENVLELTLEANVDEDSVCMLTNHAYFSLGDYDNSTLELAINADKYIHVDENDLIPLYEKEVEKATDFRQPKLIVKDINASVLKDSKMHGYDMEYLFNDININRSNVVLQNDKYILEIYTDYEGSIIYSDNFENTAKFLTNDIDLVRRGIAIEPSDHHLKNHLLQKGELYKRKIIYNFLYK